MYILKLGELCVVTQTLVSAQGGKGRKEGHKFEAILDYTVRLYLQHQQLRSASKSLEVTSLVYTGVYLIMWVVTTDFFLLLTSIFGM